MTTTIQFLAMKLREHGNPGNSSAVVQNPDTIMTEATENKT